MTKKKLLFIINPRSGHKLGTQIEPLIETNLDGLQFSWEYYYTKAPRDATAAARDAVGQKDVVVAVGGDGTINEVGRGLVGSDTVMGILPAGSGNGLARHLNIPLDIPGAIGCLNRFNVIDIDTVTINGGFFVNVAGAGFDARVAHAFAGFTRRGFFSYARAVLQEFFSYEEKEYHLVVDGRPHTVKAFLLSFANSSQYGSNVFISPLSDIRDGLVDICILPRARLWSVPAITWRLFKKSIHRSRYYTSLRGQQVSVKTSGPMELHIDGEPAGPVDDLEIRVNPLSLKVAYAARPDRPV